MTSSKKSLFGVNKKSSVDDIQITVDPRVVSDSTRRFANQIHGTRYVKVNRIDVEGTYKFVIPAKADELIDLERSFISQRLRIVGVNDDKTTRVIPKATITYSAEVKEGTDDMNFTKEGDVKVLMDFEG